MPDGTPRFNGRIGLVTGAASGLGRDAAVALAAEGARLVLFDCDAAGLAETAARCAGAVAITGDVTRAADLDRAAAALDALGPATLLVTAAGMLGPTRPLPEVTEAEFDQVLGVNVKGTWMALKAVLPRMAAAGGGAVVTIASGSGIVGNAVFPTYSVSKGAVVLMTRSVAVGHAMQGIRANTVCPGQIETPMLRGVFAQLGDRAAEVEAMFRAKNPSARFGEVQEVTAAILFLLSDAASYINGAALPIDGGRLA
ncbi:SDR family NAD(P)-dependent oxidoreductase [Falsiroseomonas tokyonensis]|uniref:SDR family NAD(P)-dependent oxidoreductase n=1 Tax=Falsiroseomonas tokyonensis TaxID=430521 RepID=A0ABV7BVF5_9PROT|nr:SDR family oxidoreductase [Falsiroseomonas tokyonensis]MBU8539236.1 SDR family oxidoreductase [Falsiroseomonas tokyonensis]